MKEKQKYNKFCKILFIILLILIICFIFSSFISNENVQLIQLKNNSHRQMMGYIIKTQNDKVIVIDGGTKEDAPNLIKHLQELGKKVDMWFITHPHSDHAGAFIDIIQRQVDIEIQKVYYTMNELEWYQQYASERAYEAEEFSDILKDSKLLGKIEEVKLNQKIYIDKVKCEILGIKNPEITEDAFNNSSMVIKMEINNISVLFLGDTGKESGNKLLETQRDKLKSDIVQVAHHGQDGADETLYKEIKPTVCLWPTPEWIWNNDDGEGKDTGPWKTMETRKWMEDLGVKKNIIEKDGDIKIEIERALLDE